MAEVLITLGIIGVVAVMTLPALIEKHNEQVTVNKVKKFYSIISQAFLLAINENGPLYEWNDIKNFADYIKPHLNISKDCGFNEGCIYNGTYKLLKGTTHNSSYNTDKSYYKIILADGSTWWYRTKTESCQATTISCIDIFYDVNGKNGPNIYGKDLFTFEANAIKIFPTNDNTCDLNNKGFSCSSYIIQNSNMNIYINKIFAQQVN